MEKSDKYISYDAYIRFLRKVEESQTEKNALVDRIVRNILDQPNPA